ncbi:MAG: hypothetical protein AAFP70_06345, partial [Calditrichota bacterium]
MIKLFVCVLFLSFGSFSLTAQTNPSVKVNSELTLFRVIANSDTGETLVEAETVFPGDEVIYRAIYKNTGRASIRSLSPVLPIPEQFVFIGISDTTQRLLASLDGESFSPIPLMLEDDEDSQENKAEVPKEEYR